MASVDDIVRGLTKAQRVRMRRDAIVLRSRHDTRVAMGLERKGLVERGRHLNQYVHTAAGLVVRARLLSSCGATDHAQ